MCWCEWAIWEVVFTQITLLLLLQGALLCTLWSWYNRSVQVKSLNVSRLLRQGMYGERRDRCSSHEVQRIELHLGYAHVPIQKKRHPGMSLREQMLTLPDIHLFMSLLSCPESLPFGRLFAPHMIEHQTFWDFSLSKSKIHRHCRQNKIVQN